MKVSRRDVIKSAIVIPAMTIPYSASRAEVTPQPDLGFVPAPIPKEESSLVAELCAVSQSGEPYILEAPLGLVPFEAVENSWTGTAVFEVKQDLVAIKTRVRFAAPPFDGMRIGEHELGSMTLVAGSTLTLTLPIQFL